MITLKAKEHWARYHELKRIMNERGLNESDNHSLSQYLHLIQGMKTAEECFNSYKRKMFDWLKNIERSAIEEIERQTKEKGATNG